MIFHRLIPAQGCSLSQQLRGQNENPPWTGHPSIAGRTHTHTHTHSGWDHSDMSVHLLGTSLGYGRKLESLEKTHTYMGKTRILHTGGGHGPEPFFSSQCHNEMLLNKTMLLDNLMCSTAHFAGS